MSKGTLQCIENLLILSNIKQQLSFKTNILILQAWILLKRPGSISKVLITQAYTFYKAESPDAITIKSATMSPDVDCIEM